MSTVSSDRERDHVQDHEQNRARSVSARQVSGLRRTVSTMSAP